MEVAQWVKVLATVLDKQSLSPGAWVGGENWLLLVILQPPFVHHDMNAYACAQTQSKI